VNNIFNRKFLAVSIAVIALLSGNIVLAKDYSVTAGNWQVDFKSNESLYTSVEWSPPTSNDGTGYYMVWVNKDPGKTSRTSSVFLFDYGSKLSAPTNRAWMEKYVSDLISGFNNTPSISEYFIDGRNATLAEGWSKEFEKFTYAAMYPFDPTTDNTAQKFVGFGSNLDKKTTFEIIDSLHVEYADSPQASQTPATSRTNNWVTDIRSQGIAQPASANPSIMEPYILIKCQGTLYNQLGSYTKAGIGKVYLVTNLQIENHGYDEFSVNPNYVKVEINNVQYDYAWASLDDLGLASLDSVTLKNGGKVTGAVAFEIPKNSDQYALVWKTWAGDPYNVKVEFVK
jgi:hypothetical protein